MLNTIVLPKNIKDLKGKLPQAKYDIQNNSFEQENKVDIIDFKVPAAIKNFERPSSAGKGRIIVEKTPNYAKPIEKRVLVRKPSYKEEKKPEKKPEKPKISLKNQKPPINKPPLSNKNIEKPAKNSVNIHNEREVKRLIEKYENKLANGEIKNIKKPLVRVPSAIYKKESVNHVKRPGSAKHNVEVKKPIVNHIKPGNNNKKIIRHRSEDIQKKVLDMKMKKIDKNLEIKGGNMNIKGKIFKK